MFPEDQKNLRPSPRSICLVVTDLGGLRGWGPTNFDPQVGWVESSRPIGGAAGFQDSPHPTQPSPWQRARFLAAKGWKVHLLFCTDSLAGREKEQAAQKCRGADLQWSFLDALPMPLICRVPSLHGPSPIDRSEWVRRGLERLQAEHSFDFIEFPTQGAVGFRTVQSRRACLAFANTRLLAYVDDLSEQARQRHQQWPSSPKDLELDFAERYAFEKADGQILANQAVGHQLMEKGWCFQNRVCFLEEKESSYLGFLQTAWKESSVAAPSPQAVLGEEPLVTLGISYFNLGRYLPDTLHSLAQQTYLNLEVLVIDDGSSEAESVAVFQEMQELYPQFRFFRQDNAGIGATRNRALQMARGDFFLPMDADNLARPDMVERLVRALQAHPEVSAVTCYFFAFRRTADVGQGHFLYAYRPTGGPLVLASLRNVYGDANALFRTAALRAVGGYETDRHTSFEDWEAFVKLVQAGHSLEVLPEPLFYYRHRETGFSRVTNSYQNHQRVLRQFFLVEHLPLAERRALWTALVGFAQGLEQLASQKRSWRYRLADGCYVFLVRWPLLKHAGKFLFLALGSLWTFLVRKTLGWFVTSP